MCRFYVVTTLIVFTCQPFRNEVPIGNDEKFEKLFAHYRNDSLKLVAARFLVENMAGKQTKQLALFYPDGTPVPADTLQDYLSLKKKFNSLDLSYEVNLRPDRVHIDTDYLIQNIDLAFEQWQASPWKAQFKFELFCEYVLPHRVGLEPLEDWRRFAMQRFSWVNDSLKSKLPMYRIACIINDSLESKFSFGDGHLLSDNAQSASQFYKYHRGRCEAMANAALFSMRAFGIPVMKDFTPAWASANGGHFWNSLYTETGRLCSFMGCESCPDPVSPSYYFPFVDGKKVSDRLYHRSAKVFRYTYSEQGLRLAPDVQEEIPAFFKLGNNIKDVTSEYMPTADIRVSLRGAKQSVVYACVFNSGRWFPVSWAYVSPEAREVTFKNMGKDIVYLVAEYNKGIVEPVADPFLFTDGGEVRALVYDSLVRRPLLLKENRSLYHPELPIEPGNNYLLYCWKKSSWRLVDEKIAKGRQIQFDSVPVNGLYQLRSPESLGMERPFIFSENGLTWN